MVYLNQLKFNLKLIFTLFRKIKVNWKSFRKHIDVRGLTKNPLFYFGLISCFLLVNIYFTCGTSADLNGSSDVTSLFLNDFANAEGQDSNSLYFGRQESLVLETPDLKIIQENSIGGVATPRVLNPKVLGDTFGGPTQERRDITEYTVQPGDTIKSVAETFEISTNTLIWANDLTASSKLKVGDTIIILPVDGVLHAIKSGDTISAIAKKYKADSNQIVFFNDLSSENDIYIGDIVLVPDGKMPTKTSSSSLANIQTTPLADNFFIFPATGRITQRLHFYNAVDLANKCGTPIYATASGVVQRVKYGYNFGGGNNITILHTGGIVTYYGHLMTIFVKPGDKVNVGDRVALMGGGTGTIGDGRSTGCHIHFQVIGAKNPLAKYSVGSQITLK